MCDEGHESTVDALRAQPSRRDVLIAGAALVTAPFVKTRTAAAQNTQAPTLSVGWASYGSDKASTKYLDPRADRPRQLQSAASRVDMAIG